MGAAPSICHILPCVLLAGAHQIGSIFSTICPKGPLCLLELLDEFFFFRPVVPGGAGGAMAPPDFGRSVNPILTRRGRLCPPHYYCHPRIFRLSYGPVLAKSTTTTLHCLTTRVRWVTDHPSPSLSSSFLVSVVRKQPWKSVANWFDHSVNSEQK